MKIAALVCFFVAFGFKGFAQSPPSDTASGSMRRFVGATFSYHPYDFFLSACYSQEKGRLEHNFRLGTGINRTIFQGRIYPRMSGQWGFLIVKKDRLQTGAMLRIDFSFVHANRNTPHDTFFFEEITPGLFIGAGKRLNYRLTAGLGPLWEQTWSEQSQSYRSWFSWSHFVELSFAYAL